MQQVKRVCTALEVLSGLLSPMARSACCSSRVKVVRGTSSDTGRTATVDRLDAWFPASHWLPEVWRARLRPEDQRRRTLGKSCCRRPVGGAPEAGLRLDLSPVP